MERLRAGAGWEALSELGGGGGLLGRRTQELERGLVGLLGLFGGGIARRWSPRRRAAGGAVHACEAVGESHAAGEKAGDHGELVGRVDDVRVAGLAGSWVCYGAPVKQCCGDGSEAMLADGIYAV